MTIYRFGLNLLDNSGAADGQLPVWNAALGRWVPANPPASGVAGITGTGNITVDNANPAHPVIHVAELLMADGVTSPPVPIETEAGDDWLYQD